MGEGNSSAGRTLRSIASKTPREAVIFWALAIVLYLVMSTLATARGIGYSERDTGGTIVFDYNGFLWLPTAVAGGDGFANPVPAIVWWALFAVVVAKALVLVVRFFTVGATARKKARRKGERREATAGSSNTKVAK